MSAPETVYTAPCGCQFTANCQYARLLHECPEAETLWRRVRSYWDHTEDPGHLIAWDAYQAHIQAPIRHARGW